MSPGALSALSVRMQAAEVRYGPFASTHEALGVIDEEHLELQLAVRGNAISEIRHELLDLAAACIRAYDCLQSGSAMHMRSCKAPPMGATE